MKSVGLQPRKICNFILSVKDDLRLKTPRVYSIPCECGQVYIGQTGCSINARLKKHHQHICVEHPNKLSMVEYSINLGHCILVHKTTILSTKPRYMNHIIREAIEI
jgi:hypothetical protein